MALNLSFSSRGHHKNAFTVVELMVVLIIVSIAALLAIPMLSSAGSTQVRSAANILAADIEYAKNLAITRQQNYYIVFNTSDNSYQIRDKDGIVIAHPVNSGKNFEVSFSNDSRLGRVKIKSADFDSSNTLFFDYLGSPYSGSSNPLNSGEVVLEADSCSLTVSIQAVTGYLTIE